MSNQEHESTPQPGDATKHLRCDGYRQIVVAWRKADSIYNSVPSLWDEVPEGQSLTNACGNLARSGGYALVAGYLWRPATGYELYLVYRPDGFCQYVDTLVPGHFRAGVFWDFMADMILSLIHNDGGTDDVYAPRSYKE